MKMLLSKWEYQLRVWAARHWFDPQLVWLTERYGAIVVTSERHGKHVLPIYHAMPDGDHAAALARQLYDMTAQRDYYRKLAEQRGGDTGSER